MGKELTKKAFFDAFWNLYQIKHPSLITVQELCEKAGYHRTTFYTYFEDIYDLLEQWERNILPPIPVIAKLAKSIKKEDIITKIPNIILHYIELHDAYYQVIFGTHGETGFIRRTLRYALPYVDKTFQIEGYSSTELAYFFDYQLSAIFGVIQHWYENDKNISKETLIHILYTITRRGFYDILQQNLQD